MMVAGCVAGAPELARADGDTITELVVGLSAPMGDDGYEAAFDTGFLIGARLGSTVVGDRRSGVALEAGLGWHLLNLDIAGFDNSFSYRLRATGGVRAYHDIKKLRVFGRFGAGIDYIDVSFEDEFLGIDFEADDLGFLLEPGGGVLYDLGSTSIGVQFAVPIAIHGGDEDELFDLDYTSTDLDILFTIGGSI